ncbi:MAG: hypothetical protein ABEJ73_07375 [Haloplanus sp.]
MIDALGIATLAFQAGIAGSLLEGLRRRNATVVVNALVSLTLALLPVFAFPRLTGIGSLLPLWVAVAGLLHCLGMLGRYESIQWWDHLTHTVSATLVAALLYAALVVSGVVRSPVALAGATILLTLAVGVFWELVELIARDVADRFDVDPVLVHYGWRDSALDLVFDVIGALAVVLFDLRSFVPVFERLPTVTSAALLWSTGVVVGGSLLMALGVRRSA